MARHTTHAHGTFSWVDLITKDTPAAPLARQFYGGLFGWTFEDLPGESQAMALSQGLPVAGIISVSAPDMPSYWNNYVSVDDADAALERAHACGGKVIQPPFEVGDAGRAAVVLDPAGAALCLWQGRKHAGAGITREPGALAWNELYTTDAVAAGRFYAEAFGWVLERGPARTVFRRPASAGPVPCAGMTPMPSHMSGAPSHWLAHFAVADLDGSIEKAKELGGRVAAPAAEVLGLGRVAILQDPHGAPFGLCTITALPA
jgi:predicted enzyme related to lactoylglutathione lyase